MNDLEKKKQAATDAEQAYNDMNYNNFKQGNDYKQLENQTRYQGNQAMKDTMGQAAARTGGYANSYAVSAGQQAQNSYMANLENAARALYDNQKQEKLEKMEVANAIYDRDKAQYEAEAQATETKKETLKNKLLSAQTVEEMNAYLTELSEIDEEFAMHVYEAWANNPTGARKVSSIISDLGNNFMGFIDSWKDRPKGNAGGVVQEQPIAEAMPEQPVAEAMPEQNLHSSNPFFGDWTKEQLNNNLPYLYKRYYGEED